MVLAERKQPRDTHLLLRGVWDKKGDKVERDVLNVLAPWPAGEEKTRLGLARWLVVAAKPVGGARHRQPLLANVIRQRAGAHAGRLRLARGGARRIPEVLDWLAVEFMEKRMGRQKGAPLDRYERDLSSTIRSHGNFAGVRSGKSSTRSCGPISHAELDDSRCGLEIERLAHSVAGRSAGASLSAAWRLGRELHGPIQVRTERRGRSVSPHNLRLLAPLGGPDVSVRQRQRRVCEVRTLRTNTPLQALTLLNDLTYVEAARVLAEIALRSAANEKDRLAN